MDMPPFDPRALGWSASNACWLCAASKLAYQPTVEARAVCSDWGLDRFVAFDRHGTHAFLAGNRSWLVVSFRGMLARELRNWLATVQFGLTPMELGRVHEGFWRALGEIRTNLLDTLRAMRDAEQPIWLTGHSLGGAMAALAAAWLQGVAQLPVQGVVTFGAPRVGHREFAARFHDLLPDRAFRVVNDDDPVTRVPPRQFDYAHVGELRFFDEHGRLQTEFTWWRKVLETVVARRWQDLFDYSRTSARDHALDAYSELLQREALGTSVAAPELVNH